jgi:hypothetical protein
MVSQCTKMIRSPHQQTAGIREVGERGRNRTYNLLIKSQLLCQLSYAPTVGMSQEGRNKNYNIRAPLRHEGRVLNSNHTGHGGHRVKPNRRARGKRRGAFPGCRYRRDHGGYGCCCASAGIPREPSLVTGRRGGNGAAPIAGRRSTVPITGASSMPSPEYAIDSKACSEQSWSTMRC